MQCDWLLGLYLDVVQREQGSEAARKVITEYLAKHTGHAPALQTALQHARQHWPTNTAYHTALMLVSSISAGSDAGKFHLCRLLR